MVDHRRSRREHLGRPAARDGAGGRGTAAQAFAALRWPSRSRSSVAVEHADPAVAKQLGRPGVRQRKPVGRRGDHAVDEPDAVGVLGGERLAHQPDVQPGATAAIPINQRRQMFAFKAQCRRVHDHNALNHVTQFSHIAWPGITHQRVNRVIGDLA